MQKFCCRLTKSNTDTWPMCFLLTVFSSLYVSSTSWHNNWQKNEKMWLQRQMPGSVWTPPHTSTGILTTTKMQYFNISLYHFPWEKHPYYALCYCQQITLTNILDRLESSKLVFCVEYCGTWCFCDSYMAVHINPATRLKFLCLCVEKQHCQLKNFPFWEWGHAKVAIGGWSRGVTDHSEKKTGYMGSVFTVRTYSWNK